LKFYVSETYDAETETRPRHWSDGIKTRPRRSKTLQDSLEAIFVVPFEKAMLVYYRLFVSIVTIALSLTIRPQFAIERLPRSNQRGGVNLGQNFGAFPLE